MDIIFYSENNKVIDFSTVIQANLLKNITLN